MVKYLRQDEGMALLLVLLLVTLLAALLSEFAFSTLVDLRLTETFRDRTQAYYLAKGGVEAGRIMLREDRNRFDHPSELWGQGVENFPTEAGTVSIRIEDLSGRFELNSIADRKGNPLPGYHRFIALCEELGIDSARAQESADSLVNWLNGDPQATTADDSYYATRQPPYARKGASLDSLDELRLVRGFDAEMVEQLSPYLRVFGGQQINLNTASAELLYAWQFSTAPGQGQIILDRAEVEEIVAYRDRQPLQKIADLEQIAGIGQRWISAWEQGSVAVEGAIFGIRGEGTVNQGVRLAEAVIDKKSNQLLFLRVE